MVSERERRKETASLPDLVESERFVLTEPEPVEVSSGYSISIKYDEKGKPLIYVKKYGDVDTRGLRREIERSYPGAAIHGLEPPKLVEVLGRQEEKSETDVRSADKKE